ncbi:hypothetical protein CDCA_CDCA12G3450 [Cyanidium caldarium]|uniref:2-dehydropantoate 2-reductase n=1 Tax=Cyanidium caldarium TaxID=2771 RepID=A0AAV9IYL7_CYACA|nr:hypothetical protein CDCA_CDCA12G3450 [Cyanidium caldarium]
MSIPSAASPPRVAIVGAGALGLLLAARLGALFAQVDRTTLPCPAPALFLLTRTEEQARALQSAGGIQLAQPFLRPPTASRHDWHALGVQVTHRAEACAPLDVALVCVKSYQNWEAAARLAGAMRCADGTLAVTLSNGLGNVEQLASGLPSPVAVCQAVTYGAVERWSPTSIVWHGAGDTHVLISPTAGTRRLTAKGVAAVHQLCRWLNAAGLPHAKPQTDVRHWLVKVAVNCAVNPVAALLDARNGILLENEAARSVAERAAAEVAHLFALDEGEVQATLHRTLQRTAGNVCSMLADLRHGRPTEIDALNGAVAQRAREAPNETGADGAPINELLAALVRAKTALSPRQAP